jgi:hypothetical protein
VSSFCVCIVSVGKALAFGLSAVQEFLSIFKNAIKKPGNMRPWAHNSIQIDKIENKGKKELVFKGA